MMGKSRAKAILELKKASMECNPKKWNGNRCVIIYPDELEIIFREFERLEEICKGSNGV